jgi:hypothetical protein
MSWRRLGSYMLILAAVAVTVRQLPELIRYLKMESM